MSDVPAWEKSLYIYQCYTNSNEDFLRFLKDEYDPIKRYVRTNTYPIVTNVDLQIERDWNKTKEQLQLLLDKNVLPLSIY